MTQIQHEKNEAGGRFVINFEGENAGEITYTNENDGKTIVIDHTEVDEKFGGKGLGKELVFAAADYAKQNNLKIRPVCSYARRVFDKETDLQSVLA